MTKFTMKVYLGTDHAGFELKEKVKDFLEQGNYEVIDFGAYSFDKEDDYPIFIGKAAESLSKDPTSRGIVFGGSGQGEAMVANKYSHVRCAVFYTSALAFSGVDVSGKTSNDPFEIMRLVREHNDANMLSLSARFLKEKEAIEAARIFLETPFSQEKRHKRRIGMIEEIEKRQ